VAREEPADQLRKIRRPLPMWLYGRILRKVFDVGGGFTRRLVRAQA
jgi:hypothetical protein